MRVWRAALDTRHFSFEAYGTTGQQARSALKRGLGVHAKALNLHAGWFSSEDIIVECFETGVPYRDRQRL